MKGGQIEQATSRMGQRAKISLDIFPDRAQVIVQEVR
jgi:hypothetical protein